MSNGVYKKASEMASIQQMLPQLLEEATQSKFESRKSTTKQSKTLKGNLEKILQQYFKTATEDRMRSQKTVLDKINPIANYKSAKSSAEMQKQMLQEIKGKHGLQKFKGSKFQPGIKESTKSFQTLADQIDPRKSAQAAGLTSALELADVIGKASGVAGGIADIAKEGFMPMIENKLADFFQPLKSFKEGFAGVKDFDFANFGALREGGKQVGGKNLAAKLAESLKFGEGNIKKLSKKITEGYSKQLDDDEEDLTQKFYFDPSDYFEYITKKDDTYL